MDDNANLISMWFCPNKFDKICELVECFVMDMEPMLCSIKVPPNIQTSRSVLTGCHGIVMGEKKVLRIETYNIKWQRGGAFGSAPCSTLLEGTETAVATLAAGDFTKQRDR